MTIQSFSVKNYKAFADPAEISVKPLTLLFGYNSAGKSALARWLPLLRDSLSSRASCPFNMKSPTLRGASFSALLSNLTDNPALSFEITGDMGKLTYVVRDLPEDQIQIVEKAELHLGSSWAGFEWGASEDKREYQITRSNEPSKIQLLEFKGLFPESIEKDNYTVGAFSHVMRTVLDDCVQNTFWIHAVRSVPARQESYRGGVSYIAPDGTGITEMIFSAEVAGKGAVQAVSDWYERATGFRLVLERGALKARTCSHSLSQTALQPKALLWQTPAKAWPKFCLSWGY